MASHSAGGLELALACRYRVGVGDERLSLGLTGGAARHPSGLRRHGALGAGRGRARGDADDADRQAAARREGAAARVSSTGWCRKRSCAAARASSCSSRPPARRAPLAERLLSRTAAARSCGAPSSRRWRDVRRARTTRRPTPSSTCGRATARTAAPAFEAEARSIAHLFTTETSRNLVRVFLLQDAPQERAAARAARRSARARGRGRRHGWGHRRVVGTAWLHA